MSPPQETPKPTPTCPHCGVPVSTATLGKCHNCGNYYREPEASVTQTPRIIPQIQSASVKVMRSHDYCHFEVVLGTGPCATPADVDALRKTAARLADKAVEQYKVAKENLRLFEGEQGRIELMQQVHAAALAKPETERTPEEQAVVKEIADRKFHQRRQYDYEDEWQEPDEYEDED